MSEQGQAAWELHSFLEERGIPYMVIGGLAVQRWGEPRLTQDVDVTVALPLDDPLPVMRELASRFRPRISDAVEFARHNRVLLLRASNGISLDVSLGLPGYEEEAIKRAVSWELEPGKVIRVCSAEDLVIHKMLAGRPRDLEDVIGILYRQGTTLDVAYIRRWLREFAELPGKSDLAARFERLWQEGTRYDSGQQPR